MRLYGEYSDRGGEERGDCDAYGVRGRSGMWMVKSSIVYGRGE